MKLDDYQTAAMSTALPSSKSIEYMTLGLAGESGEVANKVKKLIRDGDTYERRVAIADELGDVMWYLAGVAQMLQFNLNAIAEHNLDKLSRRKDENKLHGSGDNR